MEKRILFAFLLSLAVLYGSRALFVPKVPAETTPAVAGNAAQSVAETASPPVARPVPPQTPTPSVPLPPQVSGGTQATADIRADKVETASIQTPLYEATVSNQGGVLTSFRLNNYKDAEGYPIELIDTAGAAKLGWPLQLKTQDQKLDDDLVKALYRVTRENNQVTMEYVSGGVHVRKVWSFETSNYLFAIQTSVERDGRPVAHQIVWRSGFGDQSIKPDPSKRAMVYPNGTSYKRTAVASVKEPQSMSVPRVGIEDQYFLLMMFFPSDADTVKILKEEYPGADGKAVPTLQISAADSEQPLKLYIGPKSQTTLTSADPALAGVIDYGFFEVITKPLMLALLWVHSYIGNFGWSIVVLTGLITLVLFPLRIKQQVSMLKMQKIQPQMKTLQDKYKKLKANDPRRIEIQTQMMGLYKEHGINPMSGCLPLLLQMPFLLAFYRLLSVSIELRQAPWILWIRDLSQHDPFYIMPILMAASMLITQKMTPSTVDPAQARMMMIMPLMFGFMFLWAQSGLMLYWLTSNVIGIVQQVFINKYWAPANAAPVTRHRREPGAE